MKFVKKFVKIIGLIILSIFAFILINSIGSRIAITSETKDYIQLVNNKKLLEESKTKTINPLNYGYCDIGGTPLQFGFPLTTADQYSCSDSVSRFPSVAQYAGNIAFFALFIELPLIVFIYKRAPATS